MKIPCDGCICLSSCIQRINRVSSRIFIKTELINHANLCQNLKNCLMVPYPTVNTFNNRLNKLTYFFQTKGH